MIRDGVHGRRMKDCTPDTKVMKRDQDKKWGDDYGKPPFQSNKNIKISQGDNVSYHHGTNVINRFSSSQNNKSPLISSTNVMPVKVNDDMPISNDNLVSVSWVKKGTVMIVTTAKNMMNTTDNKCLNVSDHRNYYDSI